MKRLAAVLLTVSILGGFSVAQFAEVGTLDFPTSGSPEAQRYFLRGVAVLHSFGWKQAITEFQEAQQLEPDFAMAYWGETLSYNHPLFGEGLRWRDFTAFDLQFFSAKYSFHE